jgi:hypothetical protein
MSRAVLIGKVSALSREIERSHLCFGEFDLPNLVSKRDAGGDPSATDGVEPASPARESTIADDDGTAKRSPPRRNLFAENLDSSLKMSRIDELLGSWDDVADVGPIDVRMRSAENAAAIRIH